jgi:DNA-binding response OmpR family regulator
MAAPASGPKTILVIEDEPELLGYLRSVLEEQGYVCIAVSDGAEGMAAAKTRRPDLICLDVCLPEKSGVALFRDLVADPETRRIPMLLVTGITRDYERLLPGRGTVAPVEIVAKPIERDEFLAKVGAAVKRSTEGMG